MYTPSKEVCEPFILKEHHIKDILKIIEDRLPEEESKRAEPIIRYSRLDNYSHSTQDVNVLFDESNCGETRIVSLQISGNDFYFSSSPLNYRITFNSYENSDKSSLGLSYFESIKIEIKGQDKDLAELLYNDLDKYISNSVIAKKHKPLIKFLKTLSSFPIVFGTVFSFFVLFLILTLAPSFSSKNNYAEIISQALTSDDISLKLDAILIYIQSKCQPDHFNNINSLSLVVLIPVGFVFMLLSFSDKLKKKLYSLYPFVFDFGKNSENYKSRIGFLKTAIGILGSLVLGLITNYIYDIVKMFIN